MSDDPVHCVLMANAEAMKRGVLSMWTVYEKPKDWPDGFIARRFEIRPEGPTPMGDTLKGELEGLRKIFWEAGLLKLTRNAEDQPQIVETWL